MNMHHPITCDMSPFVLIFKTTCNIAAGSQYGDLFLCSNDNMERCAQCWYATCNPKEILKSLEKKVPLYYMHSDG